MEKGGCNQVQMCFVLQNMRDCCHVRLVVLSFGKRIQANWLHTRKTVAFWKDAGQGGGWVAEWVGGSVGRWVGKWVGGGDSLS